MARRTQIVLEDDLDGSPAGETVQFALDGVEYEIDLNSDHAAQLREVMAPWVGVARRTGGRRSRGTASSSKGDLAQIREWARANGLQVSERGRISTQVREAYLAAH